ncbi:DUF883 family protein [Noviherbaspirillum sp.]|uniref:DUF883 family protein n=1 Tax=Noviherbaspirillum sp. TaxID=1926288 RepID=UPI002D5E9D6E|nr:DUF883 family protein [Noviherbaspirillum sp.]HZW22804.1 DUF883 family protein [Noviherbaspirillum sp.]
MVANNIKTVRNDMKTLVKDAQDLLREASLASGDKADEMRARGLAMLETAMDKAHELQALALEKGKAAAHTTDEFVHEHPWKAVGIAAGIGLVLGMLISRR